MPFRQVIQVAEGRLVIREARDADAELLLLLREEVLQEETWFITSLDELSTGVEDERRRLRMLAKMPNAVVLVASLRGSLLGMVVIQGGGLRRTQHVGRLEIIVDRKARGAGYGRLLMEACVAWARENPMLQKLALCVFEDNTRAVALYRAMGFIEEGHRVGEYREADGRLRDDLLMYLPVNRIGNCG